MSIMFQNKGLIDIKGITTFGVCAKVTKNPIGYFGTGLKYAIAVILREGLTVTLYHGIKKYEFTAKERAIRDQKFHIVQLNGTDLAYTTELGKNWKLWMAYRELAANALDEEDNVVTSDPPDPKAGYTTFVVEGSLIDIVHQDRSEIFLHSKPMHSFANIEFHPITSASPWVYYRGIRVYELPKTAMYTYNLLTKQKLTEDRTLDASYHIDLEIAHAITKCKDMGLIRQILEAHQRYYESTIDYNWYSVSPGETFNAVLTQYGHTRVSYNSSAGQLHRRDHPKTPAPEIVQWESIPIKHRQKLRAALTFWAKLGFEIPITQVSVSDKLGSAGGTTHDKHIYIADSLLEEDMRTITMVVYKMYSRTKRPKGAKVDEEDMLVDTIVDFGERLLGLQKQKTKAA